ncbi:gp53-like domain-containing protein [Enterobacter roggenkampii]
MPPVQTPDNLFHDGNPLTGELGTIVDAEHLNNEQAAIRDTQSELIAILTAAEMEPESTAGQLLAALNKLYAPLNDTLGALSTLVGGANKLPYFTASNAAALTALSGIGRDIIGKATVADVLTYLGLGDVAKAGVAGGLLASDGYITLPLIIGGVKTNVILQWVTGPTAGAETVNYPNVTFPVTFPNACLFAAPFTVGNNTTSADQIFQAVSWTTSTAKVFPQWFGSGSQGLVHPIILAIGW